MTGTKSVLGRWEIPPRFSVQGFKRQSMSRPGIVLGQHLVALLLYALLAVAVSWPLARDFTTHLSTSVRFEALHTLWALWHPAQALAGREPLFSTQLLYYPYGISLFAHGVGPLPGFLALPFWGLGLEAGYNGAFLLALILSGYAVYLLARGLGIRHSVSLFAGVLLMMAPMPLAGIPASHVEKSFVACLPLVLLTVWRTYDRDRSAWWVVLAGISLPLTLLTSGYQFVYAGISTVFLSLWAFAVRWRTDLRFALRRAVLLAACALLLTGPLLLSMWRVSQDPLLNVDRREESAIHKPDAALFVLPGNSLAFDTVMTRLPAFGRMYHFIKAAWHPERAVTLSWVGIALCLVAYRRTLRALGPWLWLTAICLILAIGPTFQLFARPRSPGAFQIPMPYAVLNNLPGMGFMRVPGRFMMLGFVTFAICAALGLNALVVRRPRLEHCFTGLAIALVVLEGWPSLHVESRVPPVPAFYSQIAHDPEMYGVVDLPLTAAVDFRAYLSSTYQSYQLVHSKGIVSGYLSRFYASPPLFAHLLNGQPEVLPDILVNGQPARPYANAQYDLARYGYRYVVVHKDVTSEFLSEPLVPTSPFTFQTPLIDDELTTVYEIRPPASGLPETTTVALIGNWRPREESFRWFTSPAPLYVASPVRQRAVLEITPALIHDPASSLGPGLGAAGRLTIALGSFNTTVDIAVDKQTAVPITLEPGSQTLVMTLAAGNFVPADYGQPDGSHLSFAIRSLNLRLLGPRD